MSTFRPWTFDEVPVGAVLRHKHSAYQRRLLVSVENDANFAAHVDIMLAEYEWRYPHESGDTAWRACGIEITTTDTGAM